MMGQVIHIFGAAGSGTTTLGAFLSNATGFYHMDTDDYFWERTDPPYTTKRVAGERIALMRRDIKLHGDVIISGSLTDWGDVLIPLFTLVIRLETATNIRLDRIEKREREKLGDRIGVGGDMYRQHMDFVEWAGAYDSGGADMRSKLSHDEWQKKLQCRLLLLDGSRALSENYETIKPYLITEN